MAMITLTSPSKSNLSQVLSSENNKNLRDASFSSYLSSAEESLVLKLADSSQKLNPLIINPKDHIYLGNNKPEDEELDVFDAEKYFNAGMDEESAPKFTEKCTRKDQNTEETPVYNEPVKQKIRPATPSVQSESSWNSQSALLHNVARNSSRSKTNKLPRKSFLASLGCRCSCSDKESVAINEYSSSGNNFNRTASFRAIQAKSITKEPITTSLCQANLDPITKPISESWVKEETHHKKFNDLGVQQNQENCFSFPNTDSGVENMPVKLQFVEPENLQRKSLEVFGSPVLEKRNKSSGDEMLTWDETSIAEEIEIPSAGGGIYNDAASDASSDLFELESVTGKANPFLARQASANMSGCVTPTTCYAPSEASIEWSVVTASAADFSVMSDCEEFRSASVYGKPSKRVVTDTDTTAKIIMDKELPRLRSSNILLGCKSHKAVNIAGNAYRINGKAISDPWLQQKPESFMPVTRFQAETKVTGFDSRHGQRAFTTRSRSSEGSHLLYIQ